jgi:hypothetical protein
VQRQDGYTRSNTLAAALLSVGDAVKRLEIPPGLLARADKVIE